PEQPAVQGCDADRTLKTSGKLARDRSPQPVPIEECEDQHEHDDQNADTDSDTFEYTCHGGYPGRLRELNADSRTLFRRLGWSRQWPGSAVRAYVRPVRGRPRSGGPSVTGLPLRNTIWRTLQGSQI